MDEDFIQNRFGYCFYEIKDGSALIYNLFVHPEFRRQGKAKRLLQLVINEIRESRYTGPIKIEAEQRAGIDLRRLTEFYKRMGLEQEQTDED